MQWTVYSLFGSNWIKWFHVKAQSKKLKEDIKPRNAVVEVKVLKKKRDHGCCGEDQNAEYQIAKWKCPSVPKTVA